MVNISVARNWISDWRLYLAEFLGTLVFVFISSSIVVSQGLLGKASVIETAFAIGLSYVALLFATVHISGGYLNSVVTVALWLCRRLSGSRTIFYVISQVFGSIAAAFLVLFVFGSRALEFSLGMPTVGLDIDFNTAFVMEAVLSAGLVFVVYGTMVDRNGPVSFGPLALGLYVVAATLLAFGVSGAGINPARAIGPAVVSGAGAELVIYMVGPMIGSFFGVLYEFVFLKKPKKK